MQNQPVSAPSEPTRLAALRHARMSTFTPSPQQAAFFSALDTTSASIMLEAVAGSGKTTTIVQAQQRISPQSSVLFLAFNKSIATELEQRVPPHVTVKTFHAFGNAAISRSFPKRPRIDGNKSRNILKQSLSPRDFSTYAAFVTRLVGYAKSTGLLPDDAETAAPWFELINHFQLSPDSDECDEPTAIRFARRLLRDSLSDKTTVDFDDMLYVPFAQNLSFDKYQFVFVDEAQDTNSVQRDLLARMFNPSIGGRLIAVGDTHQAIYGFRGADSNALSALVDQFNMVRMPLSVSYRCSQAVVAEAQRALKQQIN